MEIKTTLAPGQNGTKQLLIQYGDQLVCVRYRYDKNRQKRHKTAEIIMETNLREIIRITKIRESENLVNGLAGNTPTTWRETQIDNQFTKKMRQSFLNALSQYHKALSDGEYPFK